MFTKILVIILKTMMDLLYLYQLKLEQKKNISKIVYYKLRSLGVTDNTEHYGCFDKGSNPLETSNKSGCPRGEEVVCKTIHTGSNPVLDSVVVAQ